MTIEIIVILILDIFSLGMVIKGIKYYRKGWGRRWHWFLDIYDGPMNVKPYPTKSERIALMLEIIFYLLLFFVITFLMVLSFLKI